MYALIHCYCTSLMLQWNPSNTDTLGPLKYVQIREESSFQGTNNTYLHGVGTWSRVGVLISQVSFRRGSTVILCTQYPIFSNMKFTIIDMQGSSIVPALFPTGNSTTLYFAMKVPLMLIHYRKYCMQAWS